MAGELRCRLKPGSLTADGVVVGLYPVRNPMQEPVVIPADFGVTLGNIIGRCGAIREAGWIMCPAALQPRILERDQLALIHRDSRAYQLFLATPPERRRHGAARP